MKHIRTLSIFAVSLAAACSNTAPANPDGGGVPAPTRDSGVSTQTTDELALRTGMRKLWEDHVFWTRMVLVDAISGLPGAETTVSVQRLQQNQIDIGNAIRPFYGNAAADQLTALLHTHISGAIDVVTAALMHDDAAFNTANDAWYANGYQIAQFLAAANPNWSLTDTQNHMKRHLDLTLAEASARISGNVAADIQGYDDVVNHILTMSDFLTSGLVLQFGDMIGPSPIPAGSEGLHLAMRKLWEDHMQWTRLYIVEQTSTVAEASDSAGRLLQNQVDIGNAIKPYYGDAAGAQLTALLKTHITGAVTLLLAFESGDQNAITAATNAWYANGNDIAQFLASANPNWTLADLQFHLKLHLDQTIAEAAARLGQSWSTDVTAYDVASDHMLVFADILSDGIAKQFPQIVR